MRRFFVVASMCASAVGFPTLPAVAQAPDGGALFEERCASCHLGDVVPRALAINNMRAMPAGAIVGALTDGAMQQQGSELSPAARRAIAEFITGRSVGADAGGMTGACTPSLTAGWPGLDGPQWNGWGVDVANTRRQTAEHAGLSAADIPRLTLKWAFGYPNAGSAQSQPTIIGGRMFIASQRGTVYALDARSGCTHWTYDAQSGVRSAMTVTRRDDGRHAVFFGDANANVYAVDADTGAEIWQVEVDDHEGA